MSPTLIVGEGMKEFARPQTANGRPQSAVPLSSIPRPLSASYMKPTSADYGSTNNLRDGTMTQERPKTATQVPRYVETEKQVLRFFAHFFERKRPEAGIEFRRTNTDHENARLVSILIYIEDETIEIHEERVLNSGVTGGQFLGRGILKDTLGRVYKPADFIIGKTYDIVGQKITITDADEFTRKYYQNRYGTILGTPFPRPSSVRPDLGAQSATGLGAKLPKSSLVTNGARSQDYFTKKEQLNKTNRFLQFEGKVLRFKCCETNAHGLGNTGGLQESIGGNNKEFALYYYLADDSVEVRSLKSKKTCLDDVNVLLRRGKIPKNWRDIPRGVPLEFYSPGDMLCGSVIDCYGRYFMLLDCDEPTREAFVNMGIEQRPIEVIRPRDVPVQHDIPKLGDGFLPIGGEEATLTTVFGQTKEIKNWKKVFRNQNRIIRSRAKMISEDGINKSRQFTITFYLEDDTIGVFEDVRRNSGMVGGNFLKRGKYVNELPPDSDTPRHFAPTDIYLGNVIGVNGLEFRLTEMDEMSVDFCESCPEEFPFFDAFSIVGGLLRKVTSERIDLRRITSSLDNAGRGWISDDAFVRMLDDTGLAERLNDQEMLTIMRRFRGEGGLNSKERKQYFYNEFVDLFSHVYHLSVAGTRSRNTSQDAFLQSLRGRSTQWRRAIRTEQGVTALGRYITLRTLSQLMEKLGTRLSSQNEAAIAAKFAVKDARIKDTVIQELAKTKATTTEQRPATPGATLRPQSAQSSVELRRQQILQSRGAGGNQVGRSSEQGADVVVDYCALCNEIYSCDWI